MGAPQYEQAGADIGGTGTPNTIPRWTGPSTLGDSVITQDGTSIGVRQATPSAYLFNSLVVGDPALGNAGITLAGGAATDGTLAFAKGTVGNNAYRGYVQYSHTTDTLRFGTAGATQVTILSTGNVGIGTASPLSTAGAGLTVYGATNGAFYLQNSSNNSRVVSNGNDVYIDAGAGGTGGAVVFRRSSSVTESARIDSSGNIILNSATTNAVIQASGTGQGLKLPATPGNTDPNTLDCYADGGTANSGGVTWTPTISFGGASTGITYQAGGQVGRYTRIGNMVYATCYIVLTNKGSAAGAVRINGLPTSANTAGLFISAHIGYFANITSTGQVMGYMASNDTGFVLNQTTAVGANTALTDANFANNSAIIATIAYPVT